MVWSAAKWDLPLKGQFWVLASCFWAGKCIGTYVALHRMCNKGWVYMFLPCALCLELWAQQAAANLILHHCSISMPSKVSQAVKLRKELKEYEERLQEAVDEYWATQDQTPLPSQVVIAARHKVKRSTLSACIRCRPSKLESASRLHKIHPDEERVIVDYLQETGHRGFPETWKWCIWHSNEVLQAWSGNKNAKGGICWLGHFLDHHHDEVQCYWSTSLTTVQGDALNQAVVGDWFESLSATITNYGIEQDCIFSMDETHCLDNCTFKTCHIGSANQLQQVALRNEARETATWFQSFQPVELCFHLQLSSKGFWNWEGKSTGRTLSRPSECCQKDGTCCWQHLGTVYMSQQRDIWQEI